MGVWIETSRTLKRPSKTMSHPAWVCGLKHTSIVTVANTAESHPAWVCGLKHTSIVTVANTAEVTPCVGVWIETARCVSFPGNKADVTPCVGVWIETSSSSSTRSAFSVTPCVGVWIETNESNTNELTFTRHTLRGCVDWNQRWRSG